MFIIQVLVFSEIVHMSIIDARYNYFNSVYFENLHTVKIYLTFYFVFILNAKLTTSKTLHS